MYGIDAQRGAGGAAAGLQPVLRTLQDEADTSAEVFSTRTIERRAIEGATGGSYVEPAPRAARTESAKSAKSAPGSATDLGPTRTLVTRWGAAAHYRRRLPWFLLALVLHGLLFALFLLPSRAPVPVAPPVPIQAEILTETRVIPPPPMPKPLTLVAPTAQIVVPVPLVSIPDPAPIAATTQPSRVVAPVTTASHAPPAPAAPISPPRFDAAYLHNPPPEYPLRARRLREQGTVLLRVEVSAEGGALLVSIDQSSGWPALDEAATQAVKRWRFEPARRGSETIAAWVLVPIEFDLRS